MHRNIFTPFSLLTMSLSLVSCGYSSISYEEFHQYALNAEANPYKTATVDGHLNIRPSIDDGIVSFTFDNLEFTYGKEHWTCYKDEVNHLMAVTLLDETASKVNEPTSTKNTIKYYFGNGFKIMDIYKDDTGALTTEAEFDQYGNIIKIKAVSQGSPDSYIVAANIISNYSK